MLTLLICLFAIISLLSVASSFFFGGSRVQSTSSSWVKAPILNNNNLIRHKTWCGMVDSAEDTPAASGNTPVDFSKFAVGQELEGTLLSSKKFGVFVDVGKGVNVLLPRSQMSRTSFEKLQRQVESKSKDKVKLELIGVSEANRTLSGKYIPSNFKVRPDLSTIQDKISSTKLYNATVISAHDFGVFAEIEEFNVEGLIPASKMPEKMPKGTIQSSYPAGTPILVKIETVNVEAKKLVLSMKSEIGRADVSQFSDISQEKWLQGVIQSVSSFGIFVRPAGYDAVGLVHYSRVPRDLLSALKKISPVAASSNKSDIESLFGEGDIIRFRVNSVTTDTKKLELSMLPFKNTDDDDEDFATMEAADRNGGEDVKAPDVIDSVDEEQDTEYDAQSTLVWWRGAAYKPVVAEESVVVKDEELEVLNESKDVIEGTWRRMFEVDMREDELDFSSKALEQEAKELEEEIGELRGLDEDMLDSLGAGSAFSANRMGSFVGMDVLPAEWRDQMEFFKEVEVTEKSKIGILKGGKGTEKSAFESLLRTVESEIERQAAKTSRRQAVAADADVAAEASVSSEPAAPAEV